MEWKDVSGIVTGLVGAGAPLIGGLLAGPAGSAVGQLVASALGCENTPDAVHQAVKADPQAAVKLAEIEAGTKVQLQQLAVTAAANDLAADTARLAEINATMRVEATSEKWWVSGWRPFWGFASAVAFTFVAGLVCFLAFQAVASHNAEALRMVPDLVSAMALLFGIPGAILGVASWHRGKEKRLRAGEVKANA